MERLDWGKRVGYFVGRYWFTAEEYLEEARKYVAERGVCTERGELVDVALRQSFFEWCLDVAKRENRMVRMPESATNHPRAVARKLHEQIRKKAARKTAGRTITPEQRQRRLAYMREYARKRYAAKKLLLVTA